MIDYAVPQTPPPSRSPLLWPLVGLALLVVINVIINPAFLKITTLDGHFYGLPIDILNQGSRCMLLALGMTLVIATGGVDLAVGSLMAVSGAVAAVLLSNHGASLPVALAAAIGISMLGGLLNGLMVACLGFQPIVATLILMTIGRGVAQEITNGEVIRVSSESFKFLGNGFTAMIPFSIILVVILYLASHFFLRRTAAGLFVEAVGDNETASRFAGLASARVKALVYVFSGLCAGVAGILAASNIGAADPYKTGEMMELDAIFAVVVGGTALTGGRFSIAGAFVGATLLQTLTTTMYVVGVTPEKALVPKAILIIAVCLMQSDKTRGWFRGLLKWRRA
jgi:ribose/xylose/arabinose/galactoside ABC-type transport system permease subunit